MESQFVPDDDGDTDAASGVSMDSLRADLAAERARADRAEKDREREQSRLDAMLKGTSEKAASKREPLGPPPDPAEDPDAYRTWVMEANRRQAEELDNRIIVHEKQVEERISSEVNAANLWAQFQRDYPDYAKRQTLARAAFASLTEDGRMPTGNEAILKAVKAEMDTLVGAPLDSISAPADRSAAVPAGTLPATPKNKTPKSEDVGKTMHEAITSWKQDHGFL